MDVTVVRDVVDVAVVLLLCVTESLDWLLNILDGVIVVEAVVDRVSELDLTSSRKAMLICIELAKLAIPLVLFAFAKELS